MIYIFGQNEVLHLFLGVNRLMCMTVVARFVTCAIGKMLQDVGIA